jgi:hypothetical protein
MVLDRLGLANMDSVRSAAEGALIAAIGLPGCGKSSVFRELGKLHQVPVFHEPEEKEWPDAVHKREAVGEFTAITWFRSQRVPQLFEADTIRRSGQIALVDSYYDKLITYYLGKPGMEWLIARSNPYFDLTFRMAEIDRKCLPNADIVVSFELEEKIWRSFLSVRNRELDRHQGLLASFATQEHFRDAAARYCGETGSKLITFKQRISTPLEAAGELSSLLCDSGVFGKTL